MTDALTCPQCDADLPSNAPAGICPRCLMQAALADSSDENSASADSPYAVTTPQPRSDLPLESRVLADRFPHLEILELLGQGGMGAVYKARQPKLDRLVALKIIRPESAGDPTFAERFNREAKTLARLSHPNIVAVHDFGGEPVRADQPGEPEQALYYFLMEYVDGANLRQVMDRGGMDPARALEIVPQICDALQFAHDEGIVHRDIKPENILIDSRGRVKIADFGLAKLASPSEQDFTLTGTHQVMGTPRYMAPEQMAGSRTVDHRADLYSLGVVFYEMLTGQIPAGHFSPPSQHAAIDMRLDDVVMKTLAQNPEDRFQSAREVRSSLEAIAQDEGGSLLSEPVAPEHTPAKGFSTIFEREVGAAWNWVVHPEKAKEVTGKAEIASFPRLLFISLAMLGGLTMFLPWAEIHIDKETSVSFVESGATLTDPVDQIYPGTSVWSSAAAGGLCFLILIVLILIPHRRAPGVITAVVMTLFSLASVGHTVAYQNELPGAQSVTLPLELRGPDAVIRQAMAEHESVDAQAPDPQSVSEEVYRYQERVSLRSHVLFEHVTYREGFYASLGLSLSLLLFSIVSVRNAIMTREPSKTEPKESWSGTPFASLRFQVPVKGDIGSKIKFHFLGLGYELEKEQPGTWIFQRGTVMGGMMQTDIRAYPTRLSIHSIQEEDGQHLINCHWSVRLMGGWAGKSDIRLLEEEGRELEALLKGPKPQILQKLVSQTAVDSTPAAPATTLPQEQLASEPEETAQSENWDDAGRSHVNLSAIESEVSGPGLAMMLIGSLITVGHIILVITLLNADSADSYLTALPGIFIGIAMLVGGFFLQGLRSQSWAQVGIIAGFLPLSPAWPLTICISIWANKALSQPQVKLAFLERIHRRRDALKRRGVTNGAGTDFVAIEEELSGPSIAMMTLGLLIALGHLALFVFSLLTPYDREMAPLAIPGLLIGIGMLVGGIHMHQLWSRGWAQLGMIAGFIPASGGWLLSLPLSIWAYKVLSRSKVKAAFLERKRERRGEVVTVPPSGVQVDFTALEEEINGPSLAMIITGMLIVLGHCVLFLMCFFNPYDQENAAFAVPGLLVGVAMSLGGFVMRFFGTRGWAQLGIIAGMIPINIGWPISLPICIWANRVFQRREIKQAFLERARLQRVNVSAVMYDSSSIDNEMKQVDLAAVEDQVNVPSIAMIVLGALMPLGHFLLISMLIETRYSTPSMVMGLIPAMPVGLLMLIGGLCLRKFASRGWAQVGIIAGMLPVSPLWVFSVGVCAWAQMLMGKHEIKWAFLDRASRRRGAVRPEPSSTRMFETHSPNVPGRILLAMLVWSVIVVVGGMASFAWLRSELSVTQIADNRAGTLIPKSGAYEQVTVTARGIGRSKLLLDESDVERTHLDFQLTPLKYSDYGGGTGVLEIELPTLGWRAPLRDTTEIGSPVGMTPNVIKEWMGLSGVDVNVEGVDEEARALFAIAEYAHQKPPHELIDRSLFTVIDAEAKQIRAVTIRYEEWQHARYCLYVWLGGVVIVLLATVPKGSTEPNSLGRTLVQFATMIMILCGAAFVLYLASGGSVTPQVRPPVDRGEAESEPEPPQDAQESSLPALHQAAAVGQISRFRRLLNDVDADINDKDSQGKTPLMYAAENNQKSMVLALIVMGANIEETDPKGRNAVMLAAEKGHADLIAALKDLENFAAICHRDDATPEQAAEHFKEFPGIDRRLLEEVNPRALKFEVPVDAQDNQGMTVAMIAATNGEIKTLETLWSMGGIGDDNRQDHLGRTLLMNAMLNGHSELVLKFLKRFVETDPAELSPVDQQGQTLYLLAEQRGATEVTDRMRELLAEEVEKYTKMIETEPQYQVYLDKLLKALETTKGTPTVPAVKERTSEATSKLLDAAARGDASEVKKLLDTGIDVNDKDDEGQTPLMMAAANGHGALCQMLLLLGANAGEQDKQGKTAVIHAAENSQDSVFKALFSIEMLSRTINGSENRFRGLSLDWRLLEDVDVKRRGVIDIHSDVKDNNGETALMKAMAKGDTELVKTMKSGTVAFDATVVDNRSRSALMHAVINQQTTLVNELAQDTYEGLSRRTPDDLSGETKLNNAMLGYFSLYRLESLQITDDDGKTVYQLATENEDQEMVESIRRILELIISKQSEAIIADGPQTRSCYRVRGKAYELLGETQKAAEDLKRAEQSSSPTERLHFAAAKGDSGRIKELLDAGASVNDKDDEGRTPLMLAAANGHASLAATLMILGANVNEKDKQGMTPMMYAVENGHEPVRKAIEDVISASRYHEKKDRIEKLIRLTGIDKRLIEGIEIDVETIKLNPFAQDNNGETVLMKAVKSQNFAYLRDAKYNQDAAKTFEVAPLQDKQGRTALMYGIELKDSDYIQQIYDVAQDYVYMDNLDNANTFVADYQVNPMFDPRALGLSNKDGLTVLQLAEQLGQDETAKLIREEMQRFVEIATRAIESEETKTKYQSLWRSWLNLRGKAYLALGEKDKAEADFQKVRERE